MTMKSRLAKMLLSAALVVVLVPLMGSDCDDDYYGYGGYGGFDVGFDWLPSWGGGGYYEETYYEETYYGGYYEDYYYEDGYYGGYYDDWWKKKNTGK